VRGKTSPPPKNSKAFSFNTDRAKHEARTTNRNLRRTPQRKEIKISKPEKARQNFPARF